MGPITKAFLLVGLPSPVWDVNRQNNQLRTRLDDQIKSYARTDPPKEPQLAVPVKLVLHMTEQLRCTSSTLTHPAMAQATARRRAKTTPIRSRMATSTISDDTPRPAKRETPSLTSGTIRSV